MDDSLGKVGGLWRKGCIAAIGLVVAVAAVGLGYLRVLAVRDAKRGWTVERLERSIRDEVPTTADRREVEAWFDRRRISCSYTADTTGDRSGNSTMPMLAGLRDEDLGGMVRGEIRDQKANLGLGNTGFIDVYFFLDRQGRVAGHLVFPFIYSL
jgi:hypothetical protein